VNNKQQQWSTLSLERKDRVLTVRFNSGHPVNAFNFEMMQDLLELANSLQSDCDLAAVVLVGQEKIFSGGMDLGDADRHMVEREGLALWRQKMQLGPRMCEAWERLEPLTIVAIEGWCIGAGVALASACDLRVGGDSCNIYVPEVEHGMTMSWGSVPRLVNLIGPARCKRLISLAEPMDAQKALDWGWLDERCVDGDSVNTAMKFAERAAAMPTTALRMSKLSINAAAQTLNHSTSYMDTDQLILSQGSEDFAEAMDAFKEKRTPNYHHK